MPEGTFLKDSQFIQMSWGLMMILLQVRPRRRGRFEYQGCMIRLLLRENLSWIALQFLSHCQKHLNRLLVAFTPWKVLEEKIIGAYVNKELSQKTARKRRVWLKSATYLLRDTLQKEKFSLKKLLKKIKIISAHGVTLIEKQKLSKFYQGSLLKASFYPVQNSQLKGMINSTVIHSCSLCFNYCRWWLDLIRKKT